MTFPAQASADAPDFPPPGVTAPAASPIAGPMPGGAAASGGPPGPAQGVSDRRLGWVDALLALVVACFVMAIAWRWRAAIIPIDPWDYVEGSINFPNGVWNEVGLSRWGMLGPIMVLGSLWGNAEATYYAYPILAAGLLGAALYLLAARLVNRWCGLLGALFPLSVPVVFVHLSRGYPDLIALAFVAWALVALLLARDAGRGWRWAAWLLLAGACVGWGFEVRELTVLAWPALAVALFRVGRPVRSFLVFAVLPAVALAGDVYLSARYFGDPLLKINALTGNSIDQSAIAADAVYLGHDRLFYLTVPFRILWQRTGGPVVLVAAAIGLVGGAVFWRRLSPIWLWGASVLFLLLAAGGSLRPGAPSIRLDIVRYNLAYLVPLVLCAVCVFAILLGRTRGWRRVLVAGAAAGLAAAALVPAVRFLDDFEGLAPNGGNSLREMGEFFSSEPEVASAQIWSDWGTQRLIPVYTVGTFGHRQWEAGDYRSLNRLLRAPALSSSRYPQPGDFVVVYSKGDQTCYHCGQALADVEAAFGQFPMPGWERVFRSTAGNLEVYRIPDGFVWPAAMPATEKSGTSQAEGSEAP